MTIRSSSIQDLQTMANALPVPLQEILHRFVEIHHEAFDSPKLRHRITRVRNRWLGEATSFDAMRRRRAPAVDEAERLRQWCQGEPDCFFCSEDGRGELLARPGSGRVSTCSYFPPSSGFDRHHCLIMPDQHDPLDFSDEIVRDMFACGERWALGTLKEAEQTGPTVLPVFYFVAWNVLCGSVIHGHSQVTLSARFAEGGVAQLAEASRNYSLIYGADFFRDFVQMHEALGLTIHLGEASAFPSLTPVKEREVWLLHPPVTPAAHFPASLLDLVRRVLECLVALAESPCPALNICVAFPPLRRIDGWDGFPIVARVVDRGWPMLGVPDWATMEMYGSRVVASDPFALASSLKSYL